MNPGTILPNPTLLKLDRIVSKLDQIKIVVWASPPVGMCPDCGREAFRIHSRGLNLEDTRLTDPKRLLRLMTAVAIAYLWIMEVGLSVLATDFVKYFDHRGQHRTLSLCQLGLRCFDECFTQGFIPPQFRFRFDLLPDS